MNVGAQNYAQAVLKRRISANSIEAPWKSFWRTVRRAQSSRQELRRELLTVEAVRGCRAYSGRGEAIASPVR
jgi:hypothetical protein